MRSSLERSDKRRLRSNRSAIESSRRFVVYVVRSNRQCCLSLWDRTVGRVVCGAASGALDVSGNVAGALALGRSFGAKVSRMGVREVHFNRRQYAYHGRVKALADGMRESGLVF